MDKYTTVQGGMWDLIAMRKYGTEKAMSVLVQANQQHADVVVFGAGTVLNIPEYEAPTPDTLPPWRR